MLLKSVISAVSLKSLGNSFPSLDDRPNAVVLQRECSNKLVSRIWYGTYLGVNISFKLSGLRPCKDLNTPSAIKRSPSICRVVVPDFSSSPVKRNCSQQTIVYELFLGSYEACDYSHGYRIISKIVPHEAVLYGTSLIHIWIQSSGCLIAAKADVLRKPYFIINNHTQDSYLSFRHNIDKNWCHRPRFLSWLRHEGIFLT